MNTSEKMKNLDEDYIIAFRNILKEAERMEREAMNRFHSWSNGTMEPAEDEVYSNAVKECAMNLKKNKISAQQRQYDDYGLYGWVIYKK